MFWQVYLLYLLVNYNLCRACSCIDTVTMNRETKISAVTSNFGNFQVIVTNSHQPIILIHYNSRNGSSKKPQRKWHHTSFTSIVPDNNVTPGNMSIYYWIKKSHQYYNVAWCGQKYWFLLSKQAQDFDHHFRAHSDAVAAKILTLHCWMRQHVLCKNTMVYFIYNTLLS